tara:strand:- start:303 stop:710 length:408 start_codon:yes stop_codon:yes gene_type:complete
MKYLLTATIILIGLMFPQIALSEHEKRQKTWTGGDLITTRVLCESEDAILEVTNADMKGPETLVLMVIGTLVEDEQCIALPFPVTFKVTKSLVEYKDFSDHPSVVLGAVAKNGDWVGWVLAAGTFEANTKKDISI